MRFTQTLFGSVTALAFCGSSFAALTGVTGGGQPFTNTQPSLGTNYIIRTEGVFSDLGEVSIFGGTFAPQGWALCDGSILSISQNDALFSRMGTTFGGDGQTTFALPDLRGRAVIGTGQGPGLTNRLIGQPVGAANVTLTEAQLPQHVHSLSPLPITTGPAGGNQPFGNMQPSMPLQYEIAVQGIFPSRNVTAPPDPKSVSAKAVTGSEPFLGEVRVQAVESLTDDRDFVVADGRLLPINQNQALFALLGTTYGGNGQTNFALPDLRGRAPIHVGNGPGLTPRNLGEASGTENVTLTTNQIPSHTHTVTATNTQTGATGGSQPHGNMQPYETLNYIIALEGVFPARPVLAGDPGKTSGGGDEPYLADITMFAGNFAPRGWAMCDGQLLSISQNTALFALLGTTYGGNGQTTFALPDLRGRTPVDMGAGPGLGLWDLGEVTGQETETLTLNELAPHSHDVADVPEPSTALAAGMALMLAGVRRRRS